MTAPIVPAFDLFKPAVDSDGARGFLARRFAGQKIRTVLLVNPPDGTAELFRIETAMRRRYPNYPPYGLGIIAQNLREVGIEVAIVNLNHEVLKAARRHGEAAAFDFDAVWTAALDDAIARHRPDAIGVTCMFTMTHESLKRTCERAAGSGIPVVIGGVHVTNDVERVLDDIPCATAAFTREGDIAIKRFVRAVNGTGAVEDLGQVILNDSDLGVRYRFLAECQPESAEMDTIPAYELLEIGDLTAEGVMGNFYGFKPPGTRFATSLSARGCRAQCTFCSVRNFNGKGVRQRSVDSVLDELQMLKEVHGVGHIVWLDDDLLKDERRAIELFGGMVRRNLGMTWDATNGVIAASCTEPVVHAMRDSGCIALNIGMESGNPTVLKQVKKPGTVRNFVEAAAVLKKFPEIHARVFLMLGFPGETMAMIADTINVARAMDLDWCSTTVLQPLPNTPIYDSMVAQGLIKAMKASEVRFNSGGYGKQNELDSGERLATRSFDEAFASIPMDAIPNSAQLEDIWFFMNYHLNFHRLFSETREMKLRQQMMNLRTLSDVISPEHGLALYFTGYLQHRLEGRIEPALIARLKRKLAEGDYWSDRFAAFGLSASDLERADFRNKEIARLLPGKLPRDDRRFEDLVLG
ncbi:MAG: radical SAM protein [Tagaea sp.]|nr:radical SAM protein [Tagaea sp.]